MISIMALWFTQKNCPRSNAYCIWRMVRRHTERCPPDKGGYTRRATLSRLCMIPIPFTTQEMGWVHVAESIIHDMSTAVQGGRLCKFYITWKLHKAANAASLHIRPIAAVINYVTCPASYFLHSQLKENVWRHPHVFKDSLDLIRIVGGLFLNGADHTHCS
jgi:hypothetical protein